jgi:hypothetical protein
MSTGHGASLFLIMEHLEMPTTIAVLCFRLKFRSAELKGHKCIYFLPHFVMF